MDFIKRTWAEIDLDALDYNIKSIKSKMEPEHKVMGIVKADAYGHGDGFVARKLQAGGFDWFGVSNIEEGMSLRNEGITKPILVLGYTPASCVEILCQQSITNAIVGIEHARSLQEAAAAANVVVEGHIKLDTGMTRVGFQTDDADFDQSLKDIIEVSKMPNVKITGIFTHHAVADSYTGDNPDFTRMQFARFDKMVTALQDAGVHVGLRHCANSATTIAYPERHIDMCRSGIITYGMLPSGECEGMIDLKPLMTVKSTIGLVKHVEKFLVEMGAGFAFMGRQYHINVSGDDYYIDILMYNVFLHRYLVIELKDTEFMPEYIGKLNFYCSAVDDILCREGDNRTIGLLLCKSKDCIKAEYALRDIQKPIGISDYELGQALPSDFRGSLPSIEEIEKELESDSNLSV